MNRRVVTTTAGASLLLGLGLAAPVGAQDVRQSYSIAAMPAAWASVDGGYTRMDGRKLNGGEALGLRLAIGYQFATRFAVEVEGTSSEVIGKRTHHDSCGQPPRGVATIDVGKAYSNLPVVGVSCSENDPVDHLGGASLALDYVARSLRGAPLLLSVGAGGYQLTGESLGWGAVPEKTRAFGVRFGLEQVVARGPEAALSLRIAPVLLPNVRRGHYWSVPVGLALWGW